jgi:4-amino-4-deoxy-L-arabinose transferase-like glycosyltransferase
VPFVVDYQGMRFGKYPPGWPATLSLGARLDAPWIVNPLLAGLAVWLVYRLGSKIKGRGVGLMAALLMGTSPMFLMLSGTLMSHNLSLVLVVSFLLAWFDLFTEAGGTSGPPHLPKWILVAVAGSALGLLTLTRPLTVLGVFLPFGLHGAYLLLRGDGAKRKQLLAVAGLALILGAILLLWQAALTGDPFLNPYTLWWEYDRVGFGSGIGVTTSGHNLHWAYENMKFSLRAGRHDLFGWPFLSWLFLPFGVYAIRRRLDGWLLASTIPSLIIVYGAYWIGSWLLLRGLTCCRRHDGDRRSLDRWLVGGKWWFREISSSGNDGVGRVAHRPELPFLPPYPSRGHARPVWNFGGVYTTSAGYRSRGGAFICPCRSVAQVWQLAHPRPTVHGC